MRIYLSFRHENEDLAEAAPAAAGGRPGRRGPPTSPPSAAGTGRGRRLTRPSR